MLRTASVRELRASLSATLSQVKAGDEIVITERGAPIAKIVPVLSHEANMEELVRKGFARLPFKPMDVEEFLSLPRPEAEGLVLAALIEDRRNGR